MPAESVIERLRRLEAEDSIWPVKVQRDDLRLLLAVAEKADAYERWCCGEGPNHDASYLEGLRKAVRALRAGGTDV